ncbi:serine hydrolase domain-containing protein [Pedobacter kyonggii]|uniref:Class A beta-lactamase-related serine hydrolase n=1 Tax=Pedobacter kyonggii TaxID=1926871 RepID=A0A4Q9HBG0_9SPHI|nr:serine hydrolase domain-containing protein [Pedobacter kyonggii]TBO41427.1 class A beta-lactamase-related serine hydrolase [Pedobacter kyonggii]
MKRLFLFLSITTICLSLHGQQIVKSGAFHPERLARIDRVVQSYIDSNWIVGAVCLVMKDGKPAYFKAFGMDDKEKGRPMHKDAIFRIASQTKAITSTAVMMLWEEGKFLLDDPVSKYIPSFASPKVLDKFNEKDSSYTTLPAKREITIRDLLTHTSGLGYAQIGSAKMQAIYAKAGIQAGFSDHKQLLADAVNKLGTLPLEFNPGERFNYSLSIDVLGRLVEAASGMSLDRFFAERIFTPLGMNDTYFHLPETKRGRLVTAYTEDAKTRKPVKWVDGTFPGSSINYPVNNNGYFAGGAGLVSTITDYAAFLQLFINKGNYLGKQLLAKHTVDVMTRNQIGDISLGDDKFGIGFQLTTAKGSGKLGLSEGSISWGGFFATSYWADPKEKLSGLLFLQQWPLKHSELSDKYKVLVYQALN